MRTFPQPVSISSPDGRHALEYYDVEAVDMDGPVFGSLRVLPEKWRFYPRKFGGPALWSNDGRYVAIPELCPAADLDPQKRTWLMVTSLDVQENKEAANLEIHNDVSFISFENGVLVATVRRNGEESRLVLGMREQTWHPFPSSSSLAPSYSTSWGDDSWLTFLLWPDALLMLPVVLVLMRVFERLSEPLDRLLRSSSRDSTATGDAEHLSQ